MKLYKWKRLHTVITNGDIKLPVECGRFSCGVTPPPGVSFTLLNGSYYINGKPCWFEIEEEED